MCVGGGGRSATTNVLLGEFTWHCSREDLDSPFAPQPPGQQLHSTHPGRGAGRAPDGTLSITPREARQILGRPRQPGGPRSFPSPRAAAEAGSPRGTPLCPPRPGKSRYPRQTRAHRRPRGEPLLPNAGRGILPFSSLRNN